MCFKTVSERREIRAAISSVTIQGCSCSVVLVGFDCYQLFIEKADTVVGPQFRYQHGVVYLDQLLMYSSLCNKLYIIWTFHALGHARLHWMLSL